MLSIARARNGLTRATPDIGARQRSPNIRTVSARPAEVELDAAGVRRLLASQHPDLAGLQLAPLAVGWDNVLYRLGEDLLVRLPRREFAAPLALNERRFLPRLAPRLPLPVPEPVRVGLPDRDYPWPWSIVRWLRGTPGDRAKLHLPDDAARRLRGFLRALHTPADGDAPVNASRAATLAEQAEAQATRMEEVATTIEAALGKGTAQLLQEVFDAAMEAPLADGPPVWIHGDLHPANVLVAGGTLAAVIDFGDITAGDPATDVAAAWMLLPLSSYATFVDAYGGVEADLEQRALGWAVHLAAMLVGIGLQDKPSYATVGLATLERVLENQYAS